MSKTPPKTPRASPDAAAPSFAVLGCQLGALPAAMQFLIVAGFMFVFMLINGHTEEMVSKKIFNKSFPLFIALARLLLCALFAAAERAATGESGRKAPIKEHMKVAVCLALSITLSQSALQYIIYPIKILFKSSKPIPVMLISAFVFGQQYTVGEYVCVTVMVLGIGLFAAEEAGLLKAGSAPTSTEKATSELWIGIALMSLAVLADGFLSNFSARTFAKYSASQAEVMLFQNLGGAVLVFVAAVATGDLTGGYALCADKGVDVLFPLFCFAATNFAGGYFVLSLNKRFGAVIMTLTSTARKAVQMAASFALCAEMLSHLNLCAEEKEFRTGHAIGGIIFLIGVACFDLNKKKKKKKIE